MDHHQSDKTSKQLLTESNRRSSLISQARNRRRPITACSECHRRKQKCNREKPCNHCSTRQVPSHCTYDGVPASRKISGNRKETNMPSTDPKQSPAISETSSESQGVPDEIGYSSFYGTDAYTNLKQLLEDEDVFRAATAITSQTQRYDPSKKFWALAAQLPPKSVQDDLITLFFRDVHWRYSVVERTYFDKLYLQWGAVSTSPSSRTNFKSFSRKLQYFPALLFQLFALTLQFVEVGEDGPSLASLTEIVDDMSACEDVSYKYSDIGTELLSLLGRHKTDSVAVQAYILRAAFLKNFGHGVEAWYVIGDAIRQAQELDFHRQAGISQTGDKDTDIEETLGKLWEDESKRRLWLILYTWDSSMALILGRPRMINPDDCNIKPPLDCAFPENPSKTVPLMQGLTASAFSIIVFRYALGQKIHEIMGLGADKRCPQEYAVVWVVLNDQVLRLLNELPLYLRPNNPDTSWDAACPFLPIHRDEVVNNINAVLMALHRPYINTRPRSREAALQAGIKCLESQYRIAEKVGPQQDRYFGCAFYTINAAILVSSVALMYPPEDSVLRGCIEHNLTQAINRLTSIEEVNLIAKSGIGIVRRCFSKVQAIFNTLNSIGSVSSDEFSSGSGNTGFGNIGYEIRGPLSNGFGEFDQFQMDAPNDPFGTFDANDFDTSYWISQVNQIPDAFGTDPTWDHLFANNM